VVEIGWPQGEIDARFFHSRSRLAPASRSQAETALSACVGDRRELSDRDGGDGSSAVPKTGPNIPNIPNTVAAEFRKAARGSPAEDS
jgi:hypothetical protein